MIPKLTVPGCSLAFLVAAASGQQSALPQTPAFRTGVDVVQIDVTVLDRNRRPVRDLTAADFLVLEDGRPRPIVAFSAVELSAPPDGAAPEAPGLPIRAIPPDVTTNALPDGRLVVILMDHQLDRPADGARVMAKRIAARIVDALGPGDVAAVVHTMFGTAQNLTTDRQRLKAAIESSAIGTVARPDDEFETGECPCGTCKLEALTRIADALGGEPLRRKTVFFVGESFPTYPKGNRCDALVAPAARAMIRAAQAANVAVHAVDPNGLQVTSVGAGENFRPEGASAAARAKETANRAGLIERHQSLRYLSDMTGGRTIVDTNAPEANVRAILDESSAYYFLAFQSSSPKPDGRFHPIAVTVNRPGVTVHTRKGYYATPERSAGSRAEDVLSVEGLARELLPRRELPLVLAAAPFRAPDGQGAALVLAIGVMAGAGEPLETSAPETEADSMEKVEILAAAFPEHRGTAEWHRQTLAISVPRRAPGDIEYEALSTLALPPGRYELRVAARAERHGLTGTVHTHVDIPEFDDALSLSGVVLHDPRAPTATPVDALGEVLAHAPTARRAFTAGDAVTAIVRVYQPRANPDGTIAFRVVDRDGHARASAEIPLAAAQFHDGSTEVRFPVPLQRLRPGPFVLSVEATAGRTTARRGVPFTVK